MAAIEEHWDNYYVKKDNDFTHIYGYSLIKILSCMPQNHQKNVLDLGSGTGQLSRELLHRGFTVLGLDISPEAIKEARAATVFDKELIYNKADLEKDFTILFHEKFSLIICKYVYAFIKDRDNFLKRVESSLESNGIFVIISPLSEWFPNVGIDPEKTKHEVSKYFNIQDYYEDKKVGYFILTKK